MALTNQQKATLADIQVTLHHLGNDLAILEDRKNIASARQYGSIPEADLAEIELDSASFTNTINFINELFTFLDTTDAGSGKTWRQILNIARRV